ncbi:MAG: transglycosylase domain-containing protein, partial [Clostridia bacterium]|nr:transglycosylase domain-containing protein [Clostridia bacterium]
MRKFLKISAVILLCLLIIIASLFTAYAVITKDAVLDRSKLVGARQNVIIYDDEGNELTSASLEIQKKSVSISKLKPDTINAFIASEDRKFYSHNGLNYGRMIKALFKNIASGSFKEGASTISQQLIKNTHLSSDKTIKRKLNEIKLTKKLEKKYSKDEILEMYLNTIYFGHNCYGLQSAAEFYFNKKAENLNLQESATIVGLLASPNNYSPFKNPDKSLKRRNLVLKSMFDCGYISDSAYSEAINSPLSAEQKTTQEKYGSYINAVFDELEEIDFDHYLLTDGCIIKTYLNTDSQNLIENLSYPCDNAVIITDNLSGGVIAYKTTINGAKRQPGSTAKPIFVYGPAIEEKYLSPFTKILDEKVNFNGYNPENYDKKYHGYVTVTDSIKNSYNIPAVKTLNALNVNTCEKYMNAMGITLDEDEKNLSLALGGMKYGLSIKELTDKYSIFPRGGNYVPSRFIKEIVSKDGKVLYKNNSINSRVFSEGTCSLMNEVLIETSKTGTGKKLKEFNFDVATKTGTCGNQNGNTDAYAVSYTSENCFAVWLGDKDNKRSEITGGNECCKLMKPILQTVYASKFPSPLDVNTGT